MGDDELAGIFAVYGRVKRVDRREHTVMVQFALVEHATAAVAAMKGKATFADGTRIWAQKDDIAGATAPVQPGPPGYSGVAHAGQMPLAPAPPWNKGIGKSNGKASDIASPVGTRADPLSALSLDSGHGVKNGKPVTVTIGKSEGKQGTVVPAPLEKSIPAGDASKQAAASASKPATQQEKARNVIALLKTK